MDIILSTRNPSKVAQIRAMFVDTPISILTLADVGINGQVDEQTGPAATLEGNARLKAHFAHDAVPGSWAMADDTGLYISAFNGEPGHDAAYWGGAALSTLERQAYCIQRLEGAVNRSAIFRITVVLVEPNATECVFIGEIRGSLLTGPRVEPHANMPYSALFVPEGSDRVLAEMATEEENAISHRGKAFRHVREYLLKQLK